MNILVLSAGTRNKIVQYLKKELSGKGKVIATDCSPLAPAIYDADEYFIVPRMTDPGYLDRILEICKDQKIDAVFSLIDPELSLLSENRDKFLEIGTTPVVSDKDTVEMCFDKSETMKCLNKYGFNTIRTYSDKEKFYKDVENGIISYPVFVKPVCGSASINISKVYNKEMVEALFALSDDLIIQEFMDGTEYGADVYIDMLSGETVSIFVKEKIKMRAGETDKSVSVKDESLFKLILDFTSKVNFRGMIDLDIFKVGNELFISEINPRFGGGYPHAYECGVNNLKLMVNNIEGKTNEANIGNYDSGVYMMKYNEIAIKRD